MMTMANENQILERRLSVLRRVYYDVCGKQLSERFLQSMKKANVPLQEKIQTINYLIDRVMEIHYRQKYLHSLLD